MQAKDFLLKKLSGPQGTFYKLRNILRRNPGVSASARVYRLSHHYVHKDSVTLDLEVEGELENGQLVGDDPITEKLIVDVQAEMKSWVRKYCGKITRDLEKELEYQQSDEAVIDSLDANERYFDVETGEDVDKPHMVTADQLPAHVQLKLVKRHTDLLNVTPQQVIQDLTRRGLTFDLDGDEVDPAQFKKVSELPDDVKADVVARNQDWNTQDEYWAESSLEFFKEELAGYGFRRVDIAYSLGGSQGDGASFTSDSVDVEQFLEKLMGQQKVESQAAVLVKELLLCG